MNLIAYKWETECKRIDIDKLIVLCELGDDYKTFCDDLELLIKSKTNKNLVSEAYQVMQGKFSIHSKKYKNFIEKHQRAIEIMNKYFCLNRMTVQSYDKAGNRWNGLTVDYFYDYIQKNKENIEIIKEIALKLKKLGFSEIYFGESLDFTNTRFEYSYNLGENNFEFLENIEIDSAYLNNPIIYKTNGSCYCMCLELDGYGVNKSIRGYNRRIYLNNLIFNPNSLPNELTPQSTVGTIESLVSNKRSEYSNIKDSIDLSIATKDLRSQFEYLKHVINGIDKIKNSDDSRLLLCQMELLLIELQNFNSDFEKEIIESNPYISEQKIEREKKLYLSRREWNELHID